MGNYLVFKEREQTTLDISGITAASTNITDLSGLFKVTLGAKNLVLTNPTHTLSGVISGTGSLTKQGAGTFTLSGANTYSGGTLVSAGTLIGNTTSLQGAITNNASVNFAQNSVGTYAGIMSGTGTLTMSGTSTLTLSGTNTYSGGTIVSSGTLQGTTTSIQGAITNNASVVFIRMLRAPTLGSCLAQEL